MKLKDAEKWVEKMLGKYIEVYGLEHWDISVEVSEQENDDCKAEVGVQFPYQKAEITIYASEHTGPEDLHESLCHELEHILDSSFYLYRHAVNAHLPPAVRRVTDALYVDCGEMARNSIGRFRANVLKGPLPPDQ